MKRMFLKIIYASLFCCTHPLKIFQLIVKKYPFSILTNYAYIRWLYQNKDTIIFEQGICQLVLAISEKKLLTKEKRKKF